MLYVACVGFWGRWKVPTQAESPSPVSLSGDLSGAKICQVLDSIFRTESSQTAFFSSKRSGDPGRVVLSYNLHFRSGALGSSVV